MSRHDFSNAFQIFHLNENTTAIITLQATFARHAMNDRRNECKPPDLHTLRCESARTNPSK